jgi:hypothetical protein
MQSRIIERSKCLPLNIPVSAAVTAATVAETMKQNVCDGTAKRPGCRVCKRAPAMTAEQAFGQQSRCRLAPPLEAVATLRGMLQRLSQCVSDSYYGGARPRDLSPAECRFGTCVVEGEHRNAELMKGLAGSALIMLRHARQANGSRRACQKAHFILVWISSNKAMCSVIMPRAIFATFTCSRFCGLLCRYCVCTCSRPLCPSIWP